MSSGYIETENMQAAVILTAATVTLALENVASAGAYECEADHQCDSGYCYLETGKCVSCIDCASYLRKVPQWRTCARGPQDCGECLAGFEYEYLTDGTARSFCVREKKIENGLLNERNPYLWTIIISILVICLLLGCLISRFYRGVKARNGEQNSNLNPEDPPPLSADNENDCPPPSYDSSVPLLQQSGVSSALCTSLMVEEKGGNTLQQAVPFTNPEPPYGTGGLVEFGNETQDSEAEDLNQPLSDENEGPRTISPPQLEDEDTIPSDWVPFRETAVLSEEPSFEQHSSVASSLSDISDIAGAPSVEQEALNDSGVSASCSHQSDLSFAHGVGGLEILTSGQNSSSNGVHSVLQRRRSEEDLSTLSDRKRQRRDSGSSSMKSVETYHKKV